MLTKNQTPQQLSLYAALTSATVTTVLAAGLRWMGLFNIGWWALPVLFAMVLTIDFSANLYFVRHYIFRKIKLIYKIIHKRKMPSDFKADKLEMDQNILKQVEKDVNTWADQNIKEQEEQEKMAMYRRRYIGDVSHELKTPIFNIQGFIHTLLDGAINDPGVNMMYLQRAAKNVERLQAIVENLEVINKMEAGQMLLDLREFSLHEITDEVISDLERRAQARNIRLTYKDGANQNFRVRADQESIRQVLINLIHNSIKYGREGGVTKVSFYDMDTYVLVEISDNGIGINAEHIPHLFERFYRVDKHRSREAGGTGLGLAIVKHIIESHKQTINVRSNPGEGATFGFTLEKA